MRADRSGSTPAASTGRAGSDGALSQLAAPTAFSVVIPAFDEDGALDATLVALRAALADGGRVFEIVVVDDGSTDATPDILAAHPDVTVLRHPKNRGYGAALKTGIQAARYPLVVVMDADGTYPTAAIAKLVVGCDTADMVVGARIGRNVHSTPARSVAKWFFRQFAQWITGSSIPDLNSGLRVFRRSLAERFIELLPDGFSFTTTITVASLVGGFAVRFEAVDYMPRIGQSKVRPIRDTLSIARQLLWLGTRLAPLRTSLAIALPILIAAIGSSACHFARRDNPGFLDVALFVLAGLTLANGAWKQQRLQRRRAADAQAHNV